MPFLINLGYAFQAPPTLYPYGSITLASAMPMHQLQRRKIKPSEQPHMGRLFFDPQLYMSSIDAIQSPKHCAKLASYPWFGVEAITQYDSGSYTQADWKKYAEKNIQHLWSKTIPNEPNIIENSIRECVGLQYLLNCEVVILPSPLTVDLNTSYHDELLWLDIGLSVARPALFDNKPVFATIALSDLCTRYSEPPSNSLLEMILDAVSSRNIDGVYLVLEQASESADNRQCSNVRSLWSILHMVHVLANDSNLRVAVNFMGVFGLACRAAGAELWASGWYKSLYRLRLADKIAKGRAFPTYWSFPASIDVNLDADFDRLVQRGLLDRISDSTSASVGLLNAARRGSSVSAVPAWVYRQSNIQAAQEHFLLSAIAAEDHLQSLSKDEGLAYVETWLNNAADLVPQIATSLDAAPKTRLDHVLAWRDAFLQWKTHREL